MQCQCMLTVKSNFIPENIYQNSYRVSHMHHIYLHDDDSVLMLFYVHYLHDKF